MEVDGGENFVVLPAALADSEEEAAWDEVGSSVCGRVDKGKMGMERTGFLVPAADPCWEGGMNVTKEPYMGLVREDLMVLTGWMVLLEKRTTVQVPEVDLDHPWVYLVMSKGDRHSVDLEFFENSLLRPAQSYHSEEVREDLLDHIRVDCNNSLSLSAKCFGMD